MMKELMQALSIEDPYEGFNVDDHPGDLQGWNSYHPNFEMMLGTYKPRIVVEVGTWKGASAIHMADLAKRMGLDCSFICVDTWLGGIEHRRHQMYYDSLRTKHGYPQLFHTFLSNVLRAGAQDSIIPFPNTSTTAGRWLKERHVSPGLVYIDGSHDTEDVFADLSVWFDILSVGGAVFGDDYSYPSVAQGIQMFAKINNLHVDVLSCNTQWVIRKTLPHIPIQTVQIIEKFTR